MIRLSSCPWWQPDTATKPAEEHRSYTTSWDTIKCHGSAAARTHLREVGLARRRWAESTSTTYTVSKRRTSRCAVADRPSHWRGLPPMSEHMTVTTADGAFQAYVARPDASSAPAVVVLHEVFGVNADMRQTCDELASKGFIAVCPDLFWRQEPGVDLNTWSDAEWKKGLALYTAYDRDAGVHDVVAAMREAGRLVGASGKVGVMGFCLGGLLAFLTASREKVD